MDNHTHDPVTGEVVELPVAAEHVAEAEVLAAADVEKTKIESETAITLAKIAAREVPRDMEAELAAALGELAALKEAMKPEDPEPAPTVVLDAPAPSPEPEPDPTELPAREAPAPMSAPKKRDGWFGDRG